MKCKNCGNDKFVAHRLVRMDVVVDNNNNWLEDMEVYDAETPYGPFTCLSCGQEHDNFIYEENTNEKTI